MPTLGKFRIRPKNKDGVKAQLDELDTYLRTQMPSAAVTRDAINGWQGYAIFPSEAADNVVTTFEVRLPEPSHVPLLRHILNEKGFKIVEVIERKY